MEKILTDSLVSAIREENLRAEDLHGSMTMDHARATVILLEEVGEVAKCVLDMSRDKTIGRESAITELVQVVSVAVRIIRNLDVEGRYDA